MSTAARRRLMRDFKVRSASLGEAARKQSSSKKEIWMVMLTRILQRMQTDPPAGVSASPIADNVMTWYATRTAFAATIACTHASLELPC